MAKAKYSKENPMEVWQTPDKSWTWYVLRKYQKNDDKPLARWFCCVVSPYAEDYGDVYVKDIKTYAERVEKW